MKINKLYCGVLDTNYSVLTNKAERIQQKINKAVERFTTVQDLKEQDRAAWWLTKWQILKLSK